MKLYYATGACSLATHIVLAEGGFSYELERVDLATKETENGTDFNTIAEKSAVPLLVLDNGEKLTEGVAILQYLADQKPEANLAPANGTFERTRLQEWLNYISTELHKAHFPLFKKTCGAQAEEVFLEKIKTAYSYVSSKLEGKSYLTGDQFTVADAYLFTVVNWSSFLDIDISPWPILVAYQSRVSARPGVQKALKAEGLMQEKAA